MAGEIFILQEVGPELVNPLVCKKFETGIHIAAADEESETARLVSEVGCGVVIPPGRPELLARTIRSAADGAYDLAEMGRRGREYVEEEADRIVAIERYRALVRELLAA